MWTTTQTTTTIEPSTAFDRNHHHLNQYQGQQHHRRRFSHSTKAVILVPTNCRPVRSLSLLLVVVVVGLCVWLWLPLFLAGVVEAFVADALPKVVMMTTTTTAAASAVQLGMGGLVEDGWIPTSRNDYETVPSTTTTDGGEEDAVVATVDDSTSASTITAPASSKKTTKRLLCIRHGTSVANEYMSRPGNRWGDATFRDDLALVDAPLSASGIETTRGQLQKQMLGEMATGGTLQTDVVREFLLGTPSRTDGVQLVLVSPLTRCLQTYQLGVEPVLREGRPSSTVLPPVLAIPLLRERVYTASDTGRPAAVLEREFPTINFDECRKAESTARGNSKGKDGNENDGGRDCWWYNPLSHPQDEWRPHGDGQWYAVPGEPESVFERRMQDLDEWLAGREETNIVMVTHWAVLRHLSGGTEWDNAEARLLEWTYCPVTKTKTVSSPSSLSMSSSSLSESSS